MKKILGVLVVMAVLAGAVLIVGPKLAGLAAARQVRQFVASATAESGVPMPTTIESGWFSSKVVTTVDVVQILATRMPTLPSNMLAALTPFMVCSSSEISHGPLPMGCAQPGGPRYTPALARVVQTSTLHLPSALASTSLVFTAYSTIKFDGTADSSLDVPAFKIVTDGGITITVGRITGTGTFSMDLKDVASSATLASFAAEGEEGSLVIGPIAAKMTTTRTPEMLRLGAQSCTIGSIAFSGGNEDSRLRVADIAIVQTARMDNGTVAASGDFTVQKIEAGGKTFGPGALRMTVSNLDAAKLGAMRTELQSLSFANKTPEEMLAVLQEMLLTNVLRLLQMPPRLELTECSLKLPNGMFRLAASCIPRVGGDAGTASFDLGLSLVAPQVHGLTPDGASTDVIRATGTLSVGKDWGKMGATLAMPGFAADMEDGSLLVRDFACGGESTRTSCGLYTGSQKLSLASFALKSELGSYRLDGFKIASSAGMEGPVMNVGVNVGFDKLATAEDMFGPANLDLSVKNLHVESLVALRNEMDKAKHSRDKEGAMAALMGKVQQMLPRIVAVKPAIELPSCALTMAHGTATLTAKAALEPVTGKPVLFANLHELLVADLHVAMPAALVEQPAGPGRPSPMAGATQFMLKTNNVYRLDVTSRGGIAMVNGEEVPLGDLMSLITGRHSGGGKEEPGMAEPRDSRGKEE